jgi:hypothetical protein
MVVVKYWLFFVPPKNFSHQHQNVILLSVSCQLPEFPSGESLLPPLSLRPLVHSTPTSSYNRLLPHLE